MHEVKRPLTVTVVVLTYNQSEFILDCLQGILKQETRAAIELIISDDASTDNTPEKIREWTGKFFPSAQVVLRDKNVGVARNWLETISLAKGKYVALCEGDDYWIDSGKLEKQVEILEKYPEINLCWHEVEILEQGIFRKHPYAPLKGQVSGIREAIQNHSIPTCSMLFRNQENWNWPSFFFSAFSIDVLVQLEVLQTGNAFKADGKMAVYRQHPGGVSKHPKQFWHSALNRMEMLVQFDSHSQGKYNETVRHFVSREASILLKYADLPVLSKHRVRLIRLLWFGKKPSTFKEKREWVYLTFFPKYYDQFLLWRQGKRI
jgi:glycosyltransferase involved in cell wall biosynthesis